MYQGRKMLSNESIVCIFGLFLAVSRVELGSVKGKWKN
jgi:hypothetical protein